MLASQAKFPPGSNSLRRKPSPACGRASRRRAPLRSGGGATIRCLYLSLRRAFPASPCTCCATTVCAAARPGAPSRTLTGWALQAGMPRSAVAAVWWAGQAGHQRRTAPYGRAHEVCYISSGTQIRSQISELALCGRAGEAQATPPIGIGIRVRGSSPALAALRRSHASYTVSGGHSWSACRVFLAIMNSEL